MRSAIVILALLSLTAPVMAEPLKAILIAPDRADAGSDVYLDGSQSEGEIQHMIFTVTPKIEGTKQIDTPKEAKDPQKPRLRTIPGRWLVTLTVIDANSDYSVATRVIEIPGGTPCPEPSPVPPIPVPPRPTPDPGPTPTPIPPKPEPAPQPPGPAPVPAGEYNVAPKVAEAVKGVSPADCKRLADALDVIAAQIAAGTLTDVQQLIQDVAAKVKEIPALAALLPKLGAILQEALATFANGKLKRSGTKMADPSAWQQLVKEIAAGLRAGK